MNYFGYMFSAFPLAGILMFDCSPLWLGLCSIAAAAVHAYGNIRVSQINKK